MPPKSNTKWYIITVILVILLLASLTWGIFNTKLGGVRIGSTPTQLPGNVGSGLFDFQNATFTGKITKLEGNRIWLENQRGVTGEAVLAQNLIISDMSQGGLATPSGDLKKIQLDKNVMISFSVVDNEYQATSISYTAPPLQISPNQTTLPPATIPLPSLDPAKIPSPQAIGKTAAPSPSDKP